MLLIYCPYCEANRPELEFRYAGEAHVARPPDPMATTDAEWAEYLYFRTNSRGQHAERWRHINGCGRYFNSVRNTVTDKFEATYKAGQPRPAATESKA
jgi:sarcosine oxidase subunit delta